MVAISGRCGGRSMNWCPVCETPAREPFLVREPVSIHQNLLVDTREAARALSCGRLALHACTSCGFVFNSAFDPALLQYGAAYENSQSHSPAFAAHLETLVGHLTVSRGIRGVRVIEIGCGSGAFLRSIVERDPHTYGVGFDPSYTGQSEDAGGRLRFERRLFDETCADSAADVIICRHVIEHIQNPVSFLRFVRRTLREGQGRVFFETPCVEWILQNDVLWDFFYEHCSYFSAASVSAAFTRAGLRVDSVLHVFGGQYLWIEAGVSGPGDAPAGDPGLIDSLATAFAQRAAARVSSLKSEVERLAANGGVAMWGAGGKGVTLAELVDPSGTTLSCVVDINPRKQGRHLPGAGHRIVAPAELTAYDVRSAVMTNPNYLDESQRMLAEAGIPVRLVHLMQ